MIKGRFTNALICEAFVDSENSQFIPIIAISCAFGFLIASDFIALSQLFIVPKSNTVSGNNSDEMPIPCIRTLS